MSLFVTNCCYLLFLIFDPAFDSIVEAPDALARAFHRLNKKTDSLNVSVVREHRKVGFVSKWKISWNL